MKGGDKKKTKGVISIGKIDLPKSTVLKIKGGDSIAKSMYKFYRKLSTS